MNVAKTLVFIIMIGLIVFMVVYLMQFYEPTKPIYDQAVSLFEQAKDYVTGNIPTVVGAGGIVTAIGGGALSKIDDAKKKAADIQSAANTQIGDLTAEKNKLIGNVEAAQAQVQAAQTELQETKTQAQNSLTIIEDQKAQIERLQSQIDGLSKQNVDQVGEDVAKKVSELIRVS